MNKLLLVPLLSLLLIVTACSGDRIIKEQKLELDSVAITFDGNEFPGASVVSARLVKTHIGLKSQRTLSLMNHISGNSYILRSEMIPISGWDVEMPIRWKEKSMDSGRPLHRTSLTDMAFY